MESNTQKHVERLQDLFTLAVRRKLVKNKMEFAEFIGIDKGTLSYAFAGKEDRVNLPRAVKRAEDALADSGITLEGNTIIGDNNHDNQNVLTPPEIVAALRSSQQHIDTLLAQQSEFLQLSSRLAEQNQLLIEKLTR